MRLNACQRDDIMRSSVPYALLSGGQKQRVAIARALVKKPALLLADEPTGAPFEETSREVLAVFDQLNQTGMTIVMVTHDEAVANRCDRVVVMQDGRFSRQ